MTPILSARRVAAGIALAAAGSMLAACATKTTTAPTGPAATPGSSNGPAAAAADTVTTLSGATVHVPGTKPAALFFFSVGCGECAGGAKSLAQAAVTAGTSADVLAVDVSPVDSKDDITGLFASIGTPTLPAAIDTNAALAQRYQVSALSTLIVLDPAGKVTYRATDPSAAQITTALKAAGAS